MQLGGERDRRSALPEFSGSEPRCEFEHPNWILGDGRRAADDFGPRWRQLTRDSRRVPGGGKLSGGRRWPRGSRRGSDPVRLPAGRFPAGNRAGRLPAGSRAGRLPAGWSAWPPGPYPSAPPAPGNVPGGYQVGGGYQSPPVPGYWSQPPASGFAPTTRTNGLAIASLVLGVLWLFWLGSVIGLVLGLMALRQIKTRNQGGRGSRSQVSCSASSGCWSWW